MDANSPKVCTTTPRLIFFSTSPEVTLIGRQTATLTTHAELCSERFGCVESSHLQTVRWGKYYQSPLCRGTGRPVTGQTCDTALLVAHPGTRLMRIAPDLGRAVSMPSLSQALMNKLNTGKVKRTLLFFTEVTREEEEAAAYVSHPS